MRILVAIESSDNAKQLSTHTLRWAARAGFNMRIFIPDQTELADYLEAINNANHNWYLDLPNSVVVYNQTPKEFAKANGYDLLLYLPDNIRKWKPGYNHDRNVLEYAKDIGAARLRFSQDSNKKAEQFTNGAHMTRV